MFALGFIRGAIFGVSIGLIARLMTKELCKKNKIRKISSNKKT